MSNEHTVEISAPPNAGALLVLRTSQRLSPEQADDLRRMGEAVAVRIRAAASTCGGEWPVVVVVTGDITLDWIPAPITSVEAS